MRIPKKLKRMDLQDFSKHYEEGIIFLGKFREEYPLTFMILSYIFVEKCRKLEKKYNKKYKKND